MKIKIFIIALLFLIIFNCKNERKNKNNYSIEIIDDSGKIITLKKPAERIISLYSAHTENLFKLGLNDKIIGVYKNDAYPQEVSKKNKYDYRKVPESIIAAMPDVVFIRPFIKRGYPGFVKILEEAKINVVSLYPASFNDFDEYIGKLSIITGTEDKAKGLLKEFKKDIESIEKKIISNQKKIRVFFELTQKIRVFFESTQKNYRTVTDSSLPALAIKFAGGINIAKDVSAINKGSSIAIFGEERLLTLADHIDIYIVQSGAMNPIFSLDEIKKRPGFYSIKAVKNNKVLIIDEKIISRPTFRFVEGVRNLAKFFYPELYF